MSRYSFVARLGCSVLAIAAAVAVVAIGGTYAAYLFAAMRRPPASPFAVTCTQAGPPSRHAVQVRFDITSTAGKDATYLNFALFAQTKNGRNLSDWGYALRRRIPARATSSATVAVPLPPDYSGLRLSGIRCNLINAAFGDGSQQDYTSDTTTFP